MYAYCNLRKEFRFFKTGRIQSANLLKTPFVRQNIKREDILKTIEDALVSALRKNLGKTAQISAKIDILTGSIQAFQRRGNRNQSGKRN